MFIHVIYYFFNYFFHYVSKTKNSFSSNFETYLKYFCKPFVNIYYLSINVYLISLYINYLNTINIWYGLKILIHGTIFQILSKISK